MNLGRPQPQRHSVNNTDKTHTSRATNQADEPIKGGAFAIGVVVVFIAVVCISQIPSSDSKDSLSSNSAEYEIYNQLPEAGHSGNGRLSLYGDGSDIIVPGPDEGEWQRNDLYYDAEREIALLQITRYMSNGGDPETALRMINENRGPRGPPQSNIPLRDPHIILQGGSGQTVNNLYDFPPPSNPIRGPQAPRPPPVKISRPAAPRLFIR